jgi:hypothetical protein
MPSAVARQLAICAAIAVLGAELSAQQLPPPLKLADVVKVTLDRGQLVVQSGYDPNQTDFTQTVKIAEFEVPADITIKRSPKGALIEFGLTLTTPIDGKTRTEILSLTPAAIEVIRDDTDDRHPDQPHSIELFQQPPGKHPRVELDRIDPDQTATKLAQAPSFAQLIAHHPHLADQFLRPIMQNDLRLEEVFGPADMLAKVVFAAELPIDPAMSRLVRQLVDQLNSDSFADRDAASRRLRDLGSDAVICLLALDRSKLSAEQAARVDQICLQPGTPSPDQIAALRQDVRFLLNCQLSGNRYIRQAAWALLQKHLGRQGVFDIDANFAARAERVENLKAQLIPQPATAPSPSDNSVSP